MDKKFDKNAWNKSTKKYWYFFLFLHENKCCGYSLEAPCGDASDEYPQHMFSWRSEKEKENT